MNGQLLNSMKPYVPILVPMLLLAVSATLFAASPASRPKVVVHDSGLAHSDFITLGDIADITPSPRASKASARLAASVLGRAPLSGSTRSLTRGDLSLKLRQSGFDPEKINIEGAASTLVATGDSDAASISASALKQQAGSADEPIVRNQPAQLVVHAGDPVDVIVADGPVTIHAGAVALSSGAAGQMIRVRREGNAASSSEPFPVTVIAAGQTQLEE